MLVDKLPAVLIALSTGLMIACLGPVNGALQARTGLWPMLTVVHLLGLGLALTGWLVRPAALTTLSPLFLSLLLGLVLVPLVLLGRQALTLGAPPLALVGGALGLLVVLGTVQAITQLGVLSALLVVILAELLGAALIDSLGLLGRPRLPLDPARLGGLLLVVAGTVLTLRRSL